MGNYTASDEATQEKEIPGDSENRTPIYLWYFYPVCGLTETTTSAESWYQ